VSYAVNINIEQISVFLAFEKIRDRHFFHISCQQQGSLSEVDAQSYRMIVYIFQVLLSPSLIA